MDDFWKLIVLLNLLGILINLPLIILLLYKIWKQKMNKFKLVNKKILQGRISILNKEINQKRYEIKHLNKVKKMLNTRLKKKNYKNW